jgi:Pilus biogenesis CpaD protein (pilus_cpaD)
MIICMRIGVLLLLAGCMHDQPQPTPSARQPCAPWFNFPTDTHSNRDSPFLGCANDRNLAVMVAHPEDLVQGRALAPANGEKTARAVETWREGKDKPLPESEPAVPTIQLPGLMAPAATSQ